MSFVKLLLVKNYSLTMTLNLFYFDQCKYVWKRQNQKAHLRDKMMSIKIDIQYYNKSSAQQMYLMVRFTCVHF